MWADNSPARPGYQPNTATTAAVNGDVASIGPTGSLRAAVGVRVFDRAFFGPEVREIWCAGEGNGYAETQIGLHVTALHVGALEWSAAGGFAVDSDRPWLIRILRMRRLSCSRSN